MRIRQNRLKNKKKSKRIKILKEFYIYLNYTIYYIYENNVKEITKSKRMNE